MFVIVAYIFNYIITLGNNQIIKLESDGKASSNSNLTVTSDYADVRTTPVPPRVEPDLSAYISSDQLNSSNAILLRLTDDTVLMEKNSEEKIYPASLTKMMTAIVAIEHLPDLKGEIKLTNSTFLGLYDADASMAGFVPGEQVMAIDLLYGVMLPSGAECCIGLAEQIAGSEQNFVNRMNQKAQDLGMEDTYIENVTGLHSDNHYTTVKDLSILLSYALQNDTFREIFTSSRHSTTPTNKHPGGITFYSTMFEKLGNQNFNDGEILGGKTGYTEEAGLCLASLAKVGQQEYILISAGAKGDHRSEQYHITDAVTVYSSLGE
jgi:D-alanyl-D-alanine carboxypeptidase (penicillin-binding protein 5/6)